MLFDEEKLFTNFYKLNNKIVGSIKISNLINMIIETLTNKELGIMIK